MKLTQAAAGLAMAFLLAGCGKGDVLNSGDSVSGDTGVSAKHSGEFTFASASAVTCSVSNGSITINAVNAGNGSWDLYFIDSSGTELISSSASYSSSSHGGVSIKGGEYDELSIQLNGLNGDTATGTGFYVGVYASSATAQLTCKLSK